MGIFDMFKKGSSEDKKSDIEKILDSGKYGEKLKSMIESDSQYIHNDVLIKILSELLIDGKIEKINNLEGTKEVGEWRYYYENGNLKQEGYFQNGKMTHHFRG